MKLYSKLCNFKYIFKLSNLKIQKYISDFEYMSKLYNLKCSFRWSRNTI